MIKMTKEREFALRIALSSLIAGIFIPIVIGLFTIPQSITGLCFMTGFNAILLTVMFVLIVVILYEEDI